MEDQPNGWKRIEDRARRKKKELKKKRIIGVEGRKKKWKRPETGWRSKEEMWT